MLNKFTSLLFITIFSISTVLVSCSSGGDDSSGGGNNGGGSQQIVPTNLVVNVTVQGQNDNDPFGDGSGNFSVTCNYF